jgi:hypothetical protein
MGSIDTFFFPAIKKILPIGIIANSCISGYLGSCPSGCDRSIAAFASWRIAVS